MNTNNSHHYFTNNFYINNVDRVIVPSAPNPLLRAPKDEVCVEDIMNLCHKNFRNILPSKINYNFDSKTFLFPFEKNQIVELLSQVDTCIQLLIQVRFFALRLVFTVFPSELAFVSEPRNPDKDIQSAGGEVCEKGTVFRGKQAQRFAQVQNFAVDFRCFFS